MEELLRQILEGQKELQLGQQRLEQVVVDIKEDVSVLKVDVAELKEDVVLIEGQQRENTDIIKALLHNQEEANAQLEAILLNTASREQVGHLEAKVDNLNTRLFNQEAEITKLKIAR